MGNYVFSTDALVDALERDAANEDSRHDMGGDIIPMMVERKDAAVYDFKRNDVPGSTPKDRDYWRDVGTLSSYHEAHLDLVVRRADLQPLQPRVADLHLARAAAGREVRRGRLRRRLHRQRRARSSPAHRSPARCSATNVYVATGATVDSSVLMDNVRIGRGARVVNAIIDKNVVVPDGLRDRRRPRGRPQRPDSPSPTAASPCSARTSTSTAPTPARAEPRRCGDGFPAPGLRRGWQPRDRRGRCRHVARGRQRSRRGGSDGTGLVRRRDGVHRARRRRLRHLLRRVHCHLSCLDFFVAVPGLGGLRRVPPLEIAIDFGGQIVPYAVGASTVAVPGVPAGLEALHQRWGGSRGASWSSRRSPTRPSGVPFAPLHSKVLATVASAMLLGDGERAYAPEAGGSCRAARGCSTRASTGRCGCWPTRERRAFYTGRIARRDHRDHRRGRRPGAGRPRGVHGSRAAAAHDRLRRHHDPRTR